MSAEIKELMERIEPGREKIFVLSTKCCEFINIYPSQGQKLVDLWSKIIEVSNQKMSLLFLCNDILHNSASESLRSLFQLSLSRAISLVCNENNSINDVRKLLKNWTDCQLFPRTAVEDWERMCSRAEQTATRSDRTNFLHIIALGKKLRALKSISEYTESAQGEDKLKAACEENKAREELIKEIVACMKKVYHGHLNITICLQRINEKIINIED